MRIKILSIALLSAVALACTTNKQETAQKNTIEKAEPTSFTNKGHELVYAMVQKVGNYNTLAQKKDVVYTYTYKTPDGKTDISTEKYFFDGELSYGLFNTHERNLAQLEGQIEQGYNGEEFWLKHKGEILSDSTYLKRVAFNRPTNFYWFAMFQKLLDPGVNYEYLGAETIDSTAYEVVKISFDSTPEKPSDIYQLHINKNTNLVDQFLFTVADFGKMEVPYLMQVEYEEVDGLLIPTKRKYKQSTWNAELNNEPWIQVTWTDISFNNGLSKADFDK